MTQSHIKLFTCLVLQIASLDKHHRIIDCNLKQLRRKPCWIKMLFLPDWKGKRNRAHSLNHFALGAPQFTSLAWNLLEQNRGPSAGQAKKLLWSGSHGHYNWLLSWYEREKASKELTRVIILDGGYIPPIVTTSTSVTSFVWCWLKTKKYEFGWMHS